MVELARENHLVLPVIETLQEIAAFTGMSKANEFLAQFQKLPVSRRERWEYKIIYPRQLFPNPVIRITRRLLLYRRSPKAPGLLGFLRYLQYAWGVGSLRSLPRRVVRRFKRALNRPGRKS